MWRARIVEDGFAVPPGTTEKDVSRDGQFRLVKVVGLDRHFQYFIVRLHSNESKKRDVLVVCAYHPPLSDLELAPNASVMASRYPTHVPAWIREDRAGWARVVCGDADSGELTAAAVAVVKASAGWDEANPIVIETDAERFAVTPTYVDGEWQAEVRHVPLGEL